MHTIKSMLPCPFCGGRKWIPWHVDFKNSTLDGIATYIESATLPLVDCIYLGSEVYKEFADECATCGAVCGVG